MGEEEGGDVLDAPIWTVERLARVFVGSLGGVEGELTVFRPCHKHFGGVGWVPLCEIGW